jgi:cell division transport system ATP-binding protein
VINNPSLLIADEPTGNVDEDMAQKLLFLFLELNKMGTTVVIATHSRSLVSQFRFPVLHLEDGRMERR